MSVEFLVLVFTSIVDTVPMFLRPTKTVLPSGVTASPAAVGPTVMSVGFLVLVLTSIVDTVPLPMLVTNAVGRHGARAGTADTPLGTSAPANPNTTTPRTHRNRRIPASRLAARVVKRRPSDRGCPDLVETFGDLAVDSFVQVRVERRDRFRAALLSQRVGTTLGARRNL
jgi:hypothetical protein